MACASEVLIAIAGEYGTLSEIALALKMGRRVIGLGTWTIVPDVMVVDTPQQAGYKGFILPWKALIRTGRMLGSDS